MKLITKLFAVAVAAASSAFAQGHDAKAAPFNAMRWSEGSPDSPEVRLGRDWYGWTRIDDVAVEDLVSFSQKTWPTKWRKRVGEDLVEVLTLMSRDVGAAVSVGLVDLRTGEALVREGVPMTNANRQAVLAYNRTGGDAAKPVERVVREHSDTVPPAFTQLAETPEWSGWERTLPRSAAEQDLDELEWLVEHTYAYRDLRGVEYRDAFDAVRAGLPEDVPLGVFTVQVAQLLALFGDGHTRVRGLGSVQPPGYLPFLVADAEDGVVAFNADRGTYVDPEFPFLIALDGKPVEAWLSAPAPTVAMGSGPFRRFHGLRELRMLNAGRVALDMEPKPTVEARLANAAGVERAVELPVARRKPTYGPWPRTDEHRLLDGNVGYLRIPSMEADESFVHGLTTAMGSFRGTRALIIDVRGNGGGTRDALNALYPYFLDPDGGPRVVNVGAYRLRPGVARGRPEGYLADRSMFPASSERWSPAERAAIRKAAAAFTPDWTPDPEEFSAWHYLVMAPGGEYHYDRPVVVLMDSGCFSATDIFLGAFADLPAATLMGTPSGGGSGRSQGIRLAKSGISLRLSSMASFRASGQRYDGKGIEVDITVRCTPEDHLVGGRDSVLNRALDWLR